MSKGHSARAWYAGRNPPSDDVLSIFDKAGKPEVLYDQASESNEGEFATLIRGVYSKMDTLKRSPDDFRTWAEEDGYVAVYEAVLEFAAPEMKARVGMLTTGCLQIPRHRRTGRQEEADLRRLRETAGERRPQHVHCQPCTNVWHRSGHRRATACSISSSLARRRPAACSQTA